MIIIDLINSESRIITIFSDVIRCSWIMGNDGKPHPFGTQDQENLVRAVIEPMASEGLRTIGIAYKNYVTGESML